MLTIFTPTYNREKTLLRLYQSLCKQTVQNFEWIIVDDGSTDNTENIVKLWIKENKINIQYYKQENKGKNAAHNKGVELAKGDLFFCVDSDDYLVENAVEIILSTDIDDDKLTGILLKKGYSINESVTKWPGIIDKSSLYDAYHYKGLVGDTALVFKTCIIKQFRFPDYEGEKFVPEAYLYDLIDQKGCLRFVDRVIYICEYLEDGYTSNIKRVIANNPHGYEAYIVKRLQIDRTLRSKMGDMIRYLAIKRFLLKDKRWIKDSRYPLLAVILCPFGWIAYLKMYRKYR